MRSKKAIYNVLTNLLLQVAVIVYGFVVPKIIIDHFGSDVNGLTASITQFLAYISLLESGFGPVVKATLYKPIAMRDKKTIVAILKSSERFFRRIAVIFIIYILVLCVVFPLIVKNDFDAIFTISMIGIIGISTFAEYFFGMTYRLFLQAKQKTYVISIIQILTYILATVLAIVFALVDADVIAIKVMTTLIFLLRPILQNIYVKKKYGINLKGASSDYKIKQKWDGLAQHIASVIHNNTDIVVLTIFTTLSEVSVYSIYILILNAIKKIVQSFATGIDSSFGDMLAKNETKNLVKKFSAYELLYMMLITVLFACTLILITPFVQIYTSGVSDTDYFRPLFGILITLSEFVWAVRLPYSTLTLAAGHFKETKKGAWVEAITNIALSVILVINFGIVGVAVGTLVAMIIRTVEFVYHTNKHILNRSVWRSVGKIAIAVCVVLVVIMVYNVVPMDITKNYFEWIQGAVIVFLVMSSITILAYTVVYRRQMKGVVKWVRGKVERWQRK